MFKNTSQVGSSIGASLIMIVQTKAIKIVLRSTLKTFMVITPHSEDCGYKAVLQGINVLTKSPLALIFENGKGKIHTSLTNTMQNSVIILHQTPHSRHCDGISNLTTADFVTSSEFQFSLHPWI